MTEFKQLWSRLLTAYDILLQRKDRETNKRLTELGIDFNEKIDQWNQETIVILRQDWRVKQ